MEEGGTTAHRLGRPIAAAAGAVAVLLWASPGVLAEPADREPKWEIGIAGGGGWTPHYPAAEQGGGAVAAIPYMKYRGRRLRVGDDGLVSGRIFNSDKVRFTASIRGSLPANSDDNRARAGMPDIDALFEIGPQLEIVMAERRDVDSISLKLPVRFVFSSDFSNLKDRGVVIEPRLSYEREALFGTEELSMTVSLGPSFASERLMDYFYEVAPQYATPERPAYQARGGYLGSNLTLGLSYDISDRFSVFLGTEFSYYGGATNADSPLFRSNTGIRAGVGFVWKAWVSESKVAD